MIKSTRCINLLVLTLAVSTRAFQPIATSRTLRVRHPPTDNPPSHPPRRTSKSRTDLSLNLTPSSVLSSVSSPLGSLTVLAFVILVHEAGHFIAARSLGIDVDEFSVGIGPRVLGIKKRRIDDKVSWEWIENLNEAGDEEEAQVERDGSIEFSLRALPLGGYVRFPPSYNQTLAFEAENEARKARDEARLLRLEKANALERGLEFMAARSFVFNAMSFGLLKKWAKRREEEQLREAEEVLSQKKSGSARGGSNNAWWKALPWNAIDVNDRGSDNSKSDDARSTLELIKAGKRPEIEYYDNANLLQNRPWQERAVVLSGGVVFNILLAFMCYFGELTVGRGLPRPIVDSGAVISGPVTIESPSYGVLKQGDIILGVNDIATYSTISNIGIFASQEEISNVISNIRQTPEGEPVRLTIVHGKNPAQFENKEVVSVVPKRSEEGIASIGIMLGPNYVKTELIKATSPIDAFSKAGSALYTITSQTASSIFGLLIDLLLGKGVPAGVSMSGPIGVVKAGADVVSSSDFAAVVAFAAGISVNLAVINSLPLPALDGGQMVFVLAEAISAKKVDQRLQEGINAGALLILLVISFGTAVGDVTSLFTR